MRIRVAVGALTTLGVLAAGGLVAAHLIHHRSAGPTFAQRARGVTAADLRFADLMVVGQLETASQLAALRTDCTRTVAALRALPRPAGPPSPVADLRQQTDRYADFCSWYVADVDTARRREDVRQQLFRSYTFTDSIRLLDGTIVYCNSASPGVVSGSHNCPTPDRTLWPTVGALVLQQVDAYQADADFLAQHDCFLPDFTDVCQAQRQSDLAQVAFGTVYARAMHDRDTRIFDWYGTPATLAVTESQAVDQAQGAVAAAWQAHGIDPDDSTKYERDQLRRYTAAIRADLAALIAAS